MKNSVIILINNIRHEELIKVFFINRIDIEIIDNNKKYIKCKININDLDKVRKLYKIKVIKEYSISNMLKTLISKMYYIILIIIGLFLYIFLTNIIVKVDILSNNKEIVKIISKELENNGIKRLSLKKNYIQLIDIKKSLLNKFNDKLEWLEIENIGMTYIIKLEERKSSQIQKDEGYCNIIAESDGYITRILSDQGVILIKSGDLVHENDILITGQISLNEEIKANICAKGLVYAEKWYNVSIDMPTTVKNKKYTNKVRYNLLFSPDNRDFKIFKSRLKNYDSEKIEIISILGKKLYYVKEYEYINEDVILNEDLLNKRIDELIYEKLELNLGDNEHILNKNVLKKEENDSRIKIEIFVTIERLISKQVTYTLD